MPRTTRIFPRVYKSLAVKTLESLIRFVIRNTFTKKTIRFARENNMYEIRSLETPHYSESSVIGCGGGRGARTVVAVAALTRPCCTCSSGGGVCVRP